MKRLISIGIIASNLLFANEAQTICNNGMIAAKYNGDMMEKAMHMNRWDVAYRHAEKVIISYEWIKPYCKKAGRKYNYANVEIKRELPNFKALLKDIAIIIN
jgi:hypothetical protein